MMIKIADSLKSAYAGITDLAKKYQRAPESITLLAVSKTKPVELIVAAYNEGQRRFGENYVSEAVEKVELLKDYPDIEWHFIGPIQSNKSRLIAENFPWVHSVDRLKIAQRLNDQRPETLAPLNVLIQVNVDNEASKAGVTLDEVNELAATIAQMPRLKLRGLMAIPAKTESEDEQNQAFAKLKHCFDQLSSQYEQIDTLSMGMSGDMEAAIAQGSTMVRIGTAIFGAREPKSQSST